MKPIFAMIASALILAACETTPATPDYEAIDRTCSHVVGIAPGRAKFDDESAFKPLQRHAYVECARPAAEAYDKAQALAASRKSTLSNALLFLGAAGAGAAATGGPTVIYPQTPAPALPAPPITCRSFNNGISTTTRCQ